jgi:hypothetical protein
MAVALVPDSTTVLGAWLRSIDGIPDNKVNTVLPAVSLWADTGFVQIVGAVGGSPWLDAPIRQPVMEVDTFGAHVNSEKPDWGKASALMNLIVEAATDPATSVDRVIPIGSRFVRLMSLWPISEVRKPLSGIDQGDPASFARLMIEIEMMWALLPE